VSQDLKLLVQGVFAGHLVTQDVAHLVVATAMAAAALMVKGPACQSSSMCVAVAAVCVLQ
jgi:hypothetical protein